MIPQRFKELGLTLPVAPKPVAAYIPASRIGNLIFVSGQIPMRNGKLMAAGKVPAQVDVETAKACARQAALNSLAVVAAHLGPEGVEELNSVVSVLRIRCFVACDPSFIDHPEIANGASELMADIFGERGRHTRAAVGAPSLPLDAPVELEMIVAVK